MDNTNQTTVPQTTPLVSLTEGLAISKDKFQHQLTAINQHISNLTLAVRPHLDYLAKYAQSIAIDAALLNIKTDDNFVEATRLLTELSPCIKRAIEYKDWTTKQFKQSTKHIDNLFKQILDPLDQAGSLLRRKTIQYRQQQQEAAQQVKEILGTAAEEIVAPTVADSKMIRTDAGSVSYTPQWVFEIGDITQIPIDILQAAVNTKRGREGLEQVIRARVEAGIRNIGGVKIYQEEKSRVK